jgi:hypothetical protein
MLGRLDQVQDLRDLDDVEWTARRRLGKLACLSRAELLSWPWKRLHRVSQAFLFIHEDESQASPIADRHCWRQSHC